MYSNNIIIYNHTQFKNLHIRILVANYVTWKSYNVMFLVFMFPNIIIRK